jgi:hypothetical protein
LIKPEPVSCPVQPYVISSKLCASSSLARVQSSWGHHVVVMYKNNTNQLLIQSRVSLSPGIRSHGLYTSARGIRNFASPLKWLLNCSSRATPGPGVPLDEPNRDRDERTRSLRFSRVPQRRHRRPPVGPDMMTALRDPGTAAPKRRPGTAGDIVEALTAINKGF